MGELRRVGLVSMHTSPDSTPGTADAGGMNVALLATATEIAARGVEVDLLTRGDAPARELAPGVTLRAVGGSAPLPKERLGEAADAFGEAVAELAGRGTPRYDVLHAHYWLSGIATLPVALELGVPFVQSFHTLAAMKNRTLGPDDAPEPERRVRSEMFLANQARAVIASSAAEVDALVDDVRAPIDKVWLVPPGVDTERFTPMRDTVARRRVRRSLGLASSHRPVLAMVGRIQPLKGQELAVRALAELRRLHGSAPVLVIAGDPTPGREGYLSHLRRLATDLGVSADVRFLGALDRDTIADLLAVAEVTLVPSRSETFGLVALESAASGTPVVAARTSGLVESVADGRSGVLLESYDPWRWAVAIDGLLEQPDRRAAFRVTAREHAERFGWASAAASLLGVYASLLA